MWIIDGLIRRTDTIQAAHPQIQDQRIRAIFSCLFCQYGMIIFIIRKDYIPKDALKMS